MLAHLVKSAVRSLAVTVVLGSILIYATGGLDSPNARAMIGVIAICFLLFWVTFFFMFGPRVPKRRSGERNGGLDETPHFPLRPGRRREHDEDSDHDIGGSESGEGD